LSRKKVIAVFIYLVLNRIFCFATAFENIHAFSGATSGKGVIAVLLAESLWISKSPLIFIVGRKQKDHTPRSLNYCLFALQ